MRVVVLAAVLATACGKPKPSPEQIWCTASTMAVGVFKASGEKLASRDVCLDIAMRASMADGATRGFARAAADQHLRAPPGLESAFQDAAADLSGLSTPCTPEAATDIVTRMRERVQHLDDLWLDACAKILQ